MDYQALYRKYRPMSFEDVIGQGHVTSTLAREVSEGRVAHSYLFAGPRGTGKTTTARIMAKALNCQNRHPDGSPDNTCESCLAITDGSSLDVMELDAASHNSVEDIRDMRMSVSTVAAASGGKRVFILDEAHMLSKAAGNALLKTLEEPPEHVYFVLATTEPYKLLDTIRSRTQRFDFHAISVEALAAHLARIADLEGLKADPSALVAVARHARGSARDSLSLLEQVAALGDGKVDIKGVNRALGLADVDAYATLAESMANRDAKMALELVARLSSEGADLRRFVAEAVGFFRGAFLAHYAPNLSEIADEPAEVLQSWNQTASKLPSGEVLRAVDILGDTLVKLREGREERLMVELALIRLSRPETAPDLPSMLSRLDRLERRSPAEPSAISSGPAPAAVSISPEAPMSAEANRQTADAGVVNQASSEADKPTTRRKKSAGKVPSEPATSRTEPAAVAAEPPDPVQSTKSSGLNASVSIAQFEAVWPQLFGGLRDLLGPRRWALFRETAPGGVEGDTLFINVRHSFHLEALRADPAVPKIVATRLGDLLGSEVKVAFKGVVEPTSAPEMDAEPDLSSVEFQKDRLVEAPSAIADPMSLVQDTLGGRIVDEFEEPDD